MSKFLGLIPARGGSVRVKDKNISPLNGVPLINYTIQAARQSKYLDRVIISTDSYAIAEVARETGAEVPFMRPPEISSKDATELDFHVHAIKWLEENEEYRPDFIVNLYPTSPFRTSETIDAAIKMVMNNPLAEGLRSVVKCSEHPYKMWQDQDGWLEHFVKSEDKTVHTLSYHLLPPVFIQNASIYIISRQTVLEKHTTVGDRMLFFEMSEEESVDINTEIDLEFAEFLINKR